MTGLPDVSSMQRRKLPIVLLHLRISLGSFHADAACLQTIVDELSMYYFSPMNFIPWNFGFLCETITPSFTQDQAAAPLNSTWILDGSWSGIVLSVPDAQFPVFAGFLPTCDHCPRPRYYFSVFFQDPSSNQSAQVVWRAGVPVSEGGMLSLTADGNLVLYRDGQGKSLVWSTGTARKGVLEMRLESSGNLVLNKIHYASPAWQSFWNPTDSLLLQQGLKSGMGMVSNSVQEAEGFQGYFTLEVGTSGIVMTAEAPVSPQIYKVWSNPSSLNVIKMSLDSGCQLKIYMTDWEPFLTTPPFCTDSTALEVLRIHADGSLRFDNQPKMASVNLNALLFNDLEAVSIGACGKKSVFDVENRKCGCPLLQGERSYFQQVDPADASKGCQPWEPEGPCDGLYISSKHVMLQASGFYNYAPLRFMAANEEESCVSSCLKDCACKAAFVSSNSSTTCFRVTEFYTLLGSSYNTTPSFKAFLKVEKKRPSAPEIIVKPQVRHHTGGWSSNVQAIVIGVFVLLLGMATATVMFITFYSKRARSDAVDQGQALSSELPRPFSLHELEVATEKLSREIGSGGFGSVFEGVLADGSRVAVKRVSDSKQVHKLFEAEVVAIISIHHKNLVRLRGFCCPNLLVYEFVANGSLDRWLFDDDKFLDCDARYSIALDIARGLSYLHDGCRTRVLHLDIKPQNILLDEKFRAKISDFGLSRQGELQAMDEMIIRGTPGYMAPEWLQSQVSDKLDTFSFGVVVLEMVTGKPASSPCGSKFLAGGVLEMSRNKQVAEIMDKRMSFSSHQCFKKMEKLLRIGLWCVQSDPGQRPSMGYVTNMLEGSLETVDAPPIPPYFRAGKEAIDMT
ncbi:G-type lectin S-receptor-like serine/threonine-protein kinase At1g34300 [Selaginella moellendorffii]|nr:G-type lectin S-receptor-like serine/threonine-protein kinase At1g34300 [Selaginella moellendorffii]|eukprot:XP_024545600.1 G-type lectin S-receptor-like serine/threonine-protein kinase At1g34300 [Selaginella moellendorffii]